MEDTRGVGEDRLSELGDDTILHMLNLTNSYRSAVTCSAASRRFKDLYTCVSSLYFDANDLIQRTEPGPFTQSDAERLGEIVEGALHRHRGPLQCLRLTLPSRCSGRVCKWVEYASINFNIQVFHLGSAEAMCFLPEFSSDTLLALSLQNVTKNSPAMGHEGFPRLRIISLVGCLSTAFRYMASFITGLPHLSCVVLKSCFFMDFGISSDTVESLEIVDSFVMPCRGGLSIRCPNLRNLTLDYKSIHGIQVDTPSELPSLFSWLSTPAALHHLETFSFSFPSIADSSPKSIKEELLTLVAFLKHTQEEYPSECQSAPKVGLKKARVRILELGEEEKFVISQLLLRCPYLELLSICSHTKFSQDKCAVMLREISTYQKASQHVQITVNDLPSP